MGRILILLLFFISGASGLVYEVVWLRMITNIMGSSVYAVSTILVAFMGGLAIGGALIGRLGDRGWNGLRLYALLEAGLAVWALLLPGALGIAEELYVTVAAGGRYPLLARFLLSLALLLPPTILMGGTLPVLGKFLVKSRHAAGGEIGRLYWANTIGAAVGCFVAGFLLIRALGVSSTNSLAAAGNIAAAGGAVLLGRRLGAGPEPESRPGGREEAVAPASPHPVATWLVLSAIGVSGFTALAYEVLWTRLLSTIFINTTYSFAAMLTVFLTGIALGSWLASAGVDRWRGLLLLFGLAEGLIGLLALASLGVFRVAARLRDAALSIPGMAGFATERVVEFLVASAVILPAALFLGAVFPVALQLYVRHRGKVGTATGELVAVNTAGALLGSVAAGFLLIPALGTWRSTIAVGSLNLVLGLALLGSAREVGRSARAGCGAAVVLGFVVALALIPGDIRARPSADSGEVLYYREGVSAAVSVVMDRAGGKRMKLNTHYSLGGGAGLLIERRMGHLAALLHPDPKRVLLIGLGTGGTAGALTLHPSTGRMDALEISPEVVEAARLFAAENHRLHDNPRVTIVIEDGRHHLKTAREPYDLIVADLFLPWQAGDGNLYALDHYALARTKLAPDGLFVQWLPLYQLSVRQLATIAATFRTVFPHTSLWLGALRTTTPIAALVGAAEPIRVVPDGLAARLSQSAPLAAELRSVALEGVEALVSLFVAAGDDLDPLTRGARLNRYDDPIVEFAAPRDLPRKASLRSETLSALVMLRRFPGRRVLAEMDAEGLRLLERDYHATTKFLAGVLRAFERDAAGERQAYLEALSQTPRHRYINQVLATMGAELIQRRQLEAAEDLCRKVVQANPENYDAMANLAAALRLQRRYPEAIVASKAAIAMNGKLEVAHLNLGLVYAETGERQKALEVFRRVLTINPRNAAAESMVKRLKDG